MSLWVAGGNREGHPAKALSREEVMRQRYAQLIEGDLLATRKFLETLAYTFPRYTKERKKFLDQGRRLAKEIRKFRVALKATGVEVSQ